MRSIDKGFYFLLLMCEKSILFIKTLGAVAVDSWKNADSS